MGKEQSSTKIHEILLELVKDDDFKTDLPSNSKAAAPHEIMSAIVGLKEFGEFFKEPFKRSLFARCITGYKYSEDNKENNLKNCLIGMLNSKVIDVDKLDYLIRDAQITGFNTVQIDYLRLLKSLTIVKSDKSVEIAYYKSAISVIENVVYAHDSERKWIQSHPVVLYENYILQHVIAHLTEKLDNNNVRLFSAEALSEKGITCSNNISVKLFCDDDIIFLMKNMFPDSLSDEFLSRKSRRHPLWKSEAEYKALFLKQITGGDVLDNFEEAMLLTTQYLNKNTDNYVINEKLISKVESEIKDIDNANLDSQTTKVQKKEKSKILKVMKSLLLFSNEEKLECDFVLLQADQFNSGFGKPDFSKTKVVFSYSIGDEIAQVGDIISSLEAKLKKRDKFFYLFYKRPNGSNEVNVSKLSSILIKEFFD